MSCILLYFQDSVPTREEKQYLLFSGLGEQKITFVKSSDPEDCKIKLEEKFPKLKGIGGYALFRSGIASKFKLEPLRIPPGGYTIEYLVDSSMLGQALCFVRPIQRDLSIEDSPMKVKFCLLMYVGMVKHSVLIVLATIHFSDYALNVSDYLEKLRF